MSILDHFPPGLTPREVQRELLIQIERMWNNTDVFVINAPVALGKSAIAYTVAQWAGRARITTPTNILVDQYKSLIPNSVKSSGQFHCETQTSSCYNVKQLQGKYCNQCTYPGQFRKGKQAPITVSTYHMLAAMRSHRKVHIFDEAHNLVHYLRDQHTKRIWPHKYGMPENCVGDWKGTKRWLSSIMELPDSLDTMLTELYEKDPLYIYEYGQDMWSGGGSAYGVKLMRGEPELLDCIYRYPININMLPNPLWNPDLRGQKLILMSATISRIDMDELGLNDGTRRVKYLEAKSPIPAENRPIMTDYVGNVNHGNISVMMDRIWERVQMMLETREHKGFIHMPYAMALRLKKKYNHPRLLFHDKTNTMKTLKNFKESSDKVMVGSGLYEGVSLDYDLARWQVISKVPWPSLASPLQQYWAKTNPDYYSWTAAKQLLQASGRVCRNPSDYGETLIIDGSFERLRTHRLMPKWFREAIV